MNAALLPTDSMLHDSTPTSHVTYTFLAASSMLRDRDAPTYGEALAEVLFQRGTDKQKHVVVGVSTTTNLHGRMYP